MIGILKGVVEEVDPDSITVMAGSVGYRVFCLASMLSIARRGATVTIYAHTHVREDDLALYGFQTKRELSFFKLLLLAPGIGPKSAMGVMAIANVDTLIRAIASGDVGFLTKVSGIGKKTAERLVVELSARIKRDHPELMGAAPTAHGDVISALIALGYTPQQAREAAGDLPESIADPEEGIRTALRALGKERKNG